jgi:hypothetical protein
MPKKIKKEKIIKRRKNGACVIERVCHQCHKEFVGERNTCSPCRAQQWRTEGKFGPAYQRQYYRRPDKAVNRPMQQAPGRAAALERHQRRIRCNIEAITQAGFAPDTTPLSEILDAGVRLDNF